MIINIIPTHSDIEKQAQAIPVIRPNLVMLTPFSSLHNIIN